MCPPVVDVKPGELGSSAGPASPPSEPRRSLLVISTEMKLTAQQREIIRATAAPIADALGSTAIIVDDSLAVEKVRDLSGLIEAMESQTAAIMLLIEQNAALLQALAEGEPDPEAEPQTYLSGSPRR